MAGYVYRGTIHDTQPTPAEIATVERNQRKRTKPATMRPATAEKLAHAEQLFAAGASQNQVHKQTGLSRSSVRQYFPDKGWLK